MVRENHADYWDKLFSHWQFWFAVVTSLVYIIGYINAALLLRAFRFYSAPTEIYSVISIFVLGVTFCVTSLVTPAIIAAFVLVLDELGLFWSRNRTILFFLIVTPIFFILLPLIARSNPLGFRIIPSYWEGRGYLFLRLFSTVTICLIGITVILLIRNRSNFRYILLLFVTIFFWTTVLLVDASRTALEIRGGAAPGEFAQHPVIHGALITRSRISSIGWEVPEFGKGVFLTPGALINRRDGAYYLSPGIFAQEEPGLENVLLERSRIVIIPETEVISFISIDTICQDC